MYVSKFVGCCARVPVRNPGYSRHHGTSSSNQVSSIISKCKHTLLCLEASHGPVTKAALGIAQGLGAGCCVYGVGYTVACLTTGVKKQPNMVFDEHESKILQAINQEESRSRNKLNNTLTYVYLSTGLLAAGISSALSFRIFQNEGLLLKISTRPLLAIGIGVITPLMFGSFVRSIDKTENQKHTVIPFGKKEMAYISYSGMLGLLAAPIYILGGQSIMRAGYVTSGVILALHALSDKLPRDSLQYLDTPVIYGINALMVSFLATLLLRQSHAAFPFLYKFVMHGGVFIYALNHLRTVQKIDSAVGSRHYDAVNAALSLSNNIMNIYGRLAFLLPPHFQVARDSVFVSTHQRFYAVNNHKRNERSHDPDGGSSKL